MALNEAVLAGYLLWASEVEVRTLAGINNIYVHFRPSSLDFIAVDEDGLPVDLHLRLDHCVSDLEIECLAGESMEQAAARELQYRAVGYLNDFVIHGVSEESGMDGLVFERL